jgi:hypothetical protein
LDDRFHRTPVHTAGNEGPLRDESDYARVVAFYIDSCREACGWL